MNYFALLAAALLFFLPTRSEEVYYPELTNLFESDLVVDASYSKADGPDFFLIRINAVLKGEQYGLAKGDYLRLRQLKHGGCGEPVYHYNHKRNRYYLKKYNVGWRIHHGTKQSIQQVHQFAGLRAEGDYDNEGNPLMNVLIKQFLECYTWNPEERRYDVKVSEYLLGEIAKENSMVAAFEKAMRINLDGTIVEPVEANKPAADKALSSIVDCMLVDQQPKAPYEHDEMKVFLTKNENPLAIHGVEGRVYVKLYIGKQGSVLDAIVVRGINPVLDSIAVQKTRTMKDWVPALNNAGKPVACTLVLPFRFTNDSLSE
jgi:hypothetical protein